MSYPIITKDEARSRGLKRYFSGQPCPGGHIVERYVGNGGCIECSKIRSLRWYHQDADRGSAWAKANKGKRNAAARARRAKNPRVREQASEWRAQNREKANEYGRRWAAKNPVATRAKNRSRRARRLAAAGSHTAADVAEIMRSQRGRCGYCRKSLRMGFHVDHIVALRRGGSNDRRNLQLLCSSCNPSKGAKDAIVFARSRGLLI
jgi:5-methylcytosine-specific restriction endonuclease McrA